MAPSGVGAVLAALGLAIAAGCASPVTLHEAPDLVLSAEPSLEVEEVGAVVAAVRRARDELVAALGAATPPPRLTVVLERVEIERLEEVPLGVMTPDGDVIRLRLIGGLLTSDRVVRHELAHTVLGWRYPGYFTCPLWLCEGLAALLEDCPVREGRLVVPERLALLGEPGPFDLAASEIREDEGWHARVRSFLAWRIRAGGADPEEAIAALLDEDAAACARAWADWERHVAGLDRVAGLLRLLGTEPARERVRILEALARRWWDGRAEGPVIALVSAPDRAVARAAIRALVERKVARAVPALAARLRELSPDRALEIQPVCEALRILSPRPGAPELGWYSMAGELRPTPEEIRAARAWWLGK